MERSTDLHKGNAAGSAMDTALSQRQEIVTHYASSLSVTPNVENVPLISTGAGPAFKYLASSSELKWPLCFVHLCLLCPPEGTGCHLPDLAELSTWCLSSGSFFSVWWRVLSPTPFSKQAGPRCSSQVQQKSPERTQRGSLVFPSVACFLIFPEPAMANPLGEQLRSPKMTYA